MIKVSPSLRKVLFNYTGESDFAKKSPFTYQKISSLLLRLNTVGVNNKHDSHSLRLTVRTKCDFLCHDCDAHAETYNCMQQVNDVKFLFASR